MTLINPLSPGVLDPGNYPGRVLRTHSYILAFGGFLCPLVSMLNYIKNKGVIIEHVEKKKIEKI